MRDFKMKQVVFAAIMTLNLSAAIGQEGGRQKMPPITSTPSASTQLCEDKTVIVILDVTGSFVDHLLNQSLAANSFRRIQENFPKLCVGSEVRVAVMGQSHRDVTGTYDHLTSKNYRISRNQYTTANIGGVVSQQLNNWIDDLRSGRIKTQNNTAVVQALYNAAEIIQLRGKPALVFVITDGDESELGGVAPPYKDGQLKDAAVYFFGAGVTLASGTQGQRALRQDWEAYFKKADASKFFWVAKP